MSKPLHLQAAIPQIDLGAAIRFHLCWKQSPVSAPKIHIFSYLSFVFTFFISIISRCMVSFRFLNWGNFWEKRENAEEEKDSLSMCHLSFRCLTLSWSKKTPRKNICHYTDVAPSCVSEFLSFSYPFNLIRRHWLTTVLREPNQICYSMPRKSNQAWSQKS